MKRRREPESSGPGTFLQILLVGVLLFAVIWQLGGSIHRDSESPESEPRAESVVETYVTTDDVNLRAGPGIEHEVLSVVPLHAEVSVTGPGANGFLPVKVDGTAAWISAEYLTPRGSVLAGTSGNVAVLDAPQEERSLPAMLVAAVSADEVETEVPEPEPEPVPTEVPVVEEPPVAVAAQTFTEEEPEAPVVEEPGERWIEVDRSTSIVTLHEGGRIVAQYDALIGKDPSADGYYATAVGTFRVHVKERQLAETPFAPGVYLTDFVGFDPARSNGFHSPTRDENGNILQTGGTATLGCVRLGEDEARSLYDFAEIGMRVEVHD